MDAQGRQERGKKGIFRELIYRYIDNCRLQTSHTFETV